MAPPFKPLPFEPSLEAGLRDMSVWMASFTTPVKVENILPLNVEHREYTVPGPDGNDLVMSVFRKTSCVSEKRPLLYHLHGGGMIRGTRFLTIGWALKCVEELDVVCASIEYRLAPQHPDPAPVEDCYAGLIWLAMHANELGIDVLKIVINGVSAGGGLAAGVSLLCRDRGSPSLLGQALFCPMLDDRNDTVSAHQFAGVGVWDRGDNLKGWTALLGERRGTDQVSAYASPARATDLSGLPPAYIDVGSAETFRDESVAYAQQLWQDGVQCELHVWPGGFHGFEGICPTAPLTQIAEKAKMEWIRRLFSQ